jgi:hypothetical protein
MNKEKVVFVGLDVSKATLAVSVADDGRDGEVRDWGTISTAPTSVEKFLKKLAARFDRVEICYEAGPTGYGLYRQITAFGFTCYVVAPSLIPVRPGERIKTDRRDAERLARLLRAGELTPIWVPDETHEAMRGMTKVAEPGPASRLLSRPASSTTSNHTLISRQRSKPSQQDIQPPASTNSCPGALTNRPDTAYKIA